jgi:predicted molibdopterin-dependent oxidoreductase YjgC
MFKRATSSGAAPQTPPQDITLEIDGTPVHARAGDTVAAALLLAGRNDCRRTPVSGAARGPYCLMGVCFECLVSIDGVANRQACMEPVRAGMVVQTMAGARTAVDGAATGAAMGTVPGAAGGTRR